MTNLMDKEKTLRLWHTAYYAFMSNWNRKAKWDKKALNHVLVYSSSGIDNLSSAKWKFLHSTGNKQLF